VTPHGLPNSRLQRIAAAGAYMSGAPGVLPSNPAAAEPPSRSADED